MKQISNLLLVGTLACLVTACGGDKEEKEQSPNYQEHAPNVMDQAEKLSKKKASDGEGHDMNNMKADDMADLKDAKPVLTTESGISVFNPVAGINFPGQNISAAFVIIKNDGKEDVEATAISSNVAKVTEFHTMEMKNDRMIMRKMDKVIIPAGGVFAMKRGSDKHIMLIDLKQSLQVGDDVTIDIDLSNGEKLNFTVKAQDLNEDAIMPKKDGMDHSKMDHSKMDHGQMDYSKMDHSDMKHDDMKKEESSK